MPWMPAGPRPVTPEGQLQGDFDDTEDDPHTFRRKPDNTSTRTHGAHSRPWDPQGSDYDWKDGRLVAGTRASDRDATRYQELGARTGPAIQLDQGQANESRGLQLNALGLLRAQADGSAPSAAAIMSQRANQNAASGIGGAGASARSAGGGIAAQRKAAGTAAPAMLAANAQNAGSRLGEISQGQSGYASGTGTAHGQDVGVAVTNAQLVAQQRALEQQRQQYYEGLGFDTQNTQMVAARQDANNRMTQQLADEAHEAGVRQKETQAVKDGLSMSFSTLSDPRTKTAAKPIDMGSLGALTRGRR